MLKINFKFVFFTKDFSFAKVNEGSFGTFRNILVVKISKLNNYLSASHLLGENCTREWAAQGRFWFPASQLKVSELIFTDLGNVREHNRVTCPQNRQGCPILPHE
jgi:hypothetical protein